MELVDISLVLHTIIGQDRSEIKFIKNNSELALIGINLAQIGSVRLKLDQFGSNRLKSVLLIGLYHTE